VSKAKLWWTEQDEARRVMGEATAIVASEVVGMVANPVTDGHFLGATFRRVLDIYDEAEARDAEVRHGGAEAATLFL
jgi:hypothetical protein